MTLIDKEIGHCFFGAYQKKMVNCCVWTQLPSSLKLRRD